jgi:hypothetical protein
MTRGRLNEKHVQQVALTQLELRYGSRAGVQALVAEPEVGVSKHSKIGFGRADGLVASLMPDGTVYTAALEAKSARTLPNIVLRYGDKQWFLHALIAGLVGLLLVGSIGWLFSGAWLLRWVLPVVAFFGVGFTYLLLTVEHVRYKLIDVVRQVKRYPANEQWIAVSADAYNEIAGDLQAALRSECQREGIGLMRVRSATHITFLEEPRPQRPPKGLDDFLECYARSTMIREQLRTMAESRK